eukprot:scaffold23205_cov99-Isochrysis_galbana.AAC.1
MTRMHVLYPGERGFRGANHRHLPEAWRFGWPANLAVPGYAWLLEGFGRPTGPRAGQPPSTY